MLMRLWRFLVTGPSSERNSGGYPIRTTLLIIAGLVAALSGGLMFLTYEAITTKTVNPVVVGALIGLLPVGITSLANLGNTLLNERQSKPGDDDQS